jgi:protein CpxP
MKRRLLATLIGLGMLAGCGKAGPIAPMAAPPQQQQTADSFSLQHRDKGHRMFAELKLTDAQKQKIKKIMAEARSERKEDREALKELITAKTVDKEALSAAIQDKMANYGDKVDRKVSMLADIRAVLTPEQRDKAAELLRERATKAKSHGERHKKIRAKMSRIADKLEMTDDQRAKFKAVLDAYDAGSDARHERWAAKKEAMAAFAESGDEAALRAALMAARPEIPVAAIVDAMASLDQDQRQKLMKMHMKMHQKRMGKCPTGTDAKSQSHEDDDEAMIGARSDDRMDKAESSQIESGDGQDDNNDEDDDD